MDIKLKNQLLCSMTKIDKRLSFYGNANIFNISVLSMIYDLISCNSDISHECLIKLENIAQEMINTSEDICNIRGESVHIDTSPIRILVNLNNKPSIDDVSITFNDGTDTYTFNESQFKVNFTDADGELPDLVEISVLPITGTLQYNGQDISSGFLFNIEDASNLTYIRDNSQYTDTFKFKTSDNNETHKIFSDMATFTITVDGQVNQPPSAVGDGSRTTSYGTTITFTRADFTTNTTPPYADPEGDAAATLKVLSLPATGTLKLNGVDVSINDEIDFTTEIDAGLLTYVPDDSVTSSYSPSFDFSIADEGSGQFTS